MKGPGHRRVAELGPEDRNAQRQGRDICLLYSCDVWSTPPYWLKARAMVLRGLVEDHEAWVVWCMGAWLLDGAGFHVDVEVLETAARAMGEIAADQNASELAELCDGDAQAIGSDVMCEALVSFCETMSQSIDYLVDKAEETGEGLSEAARTYREADHAAMQQLGGDPAAAVMDEQF